MGYFFDSKRFSEDTYKPDRKDLNIARRLASQNPYASQDALFSQQGRMFIARNPGKTNRKGGQSMATFERYFPGGYQPPAPPPKPAPAPKPKAAPKPPAPTKDDTFSKAAAALMKTAEASLAALNKPQENLNKPQEKMRILQTGSIGVDTAPLQIGPSAPTPKTSGVDSFKRKKASTSSALKVLTQNTLNI